MKTQVYKANLFRIIVGPSRIFNETLSFKSEFVTDCS